MCYYDMKCCYIFLNFIFFVVLNCFFIFSFYLIIIIIYKRVVKKESICYVIFDIWDILVVYYLFFEWKKIYVIWLCWLCDSYSWLDVSFKFYRDLLRLKIINCCFF